MQQRRRGGPLSRAQGLKGPSPSDHRAKMGLFLTAFGLMMIFEGIPYFCFPNQFKKLARKIPEMPNGALRTIGLCIMILGLGLVYFGRSLSEP
ncbi:MAG: DUF2065 domain-containing protein [Nitrospinaceae bacterium]